MQRESSRLVRCGWRAKEKKGGAGVFLRPLFWSASISNGKVSDSDPIYSVTDAGRAALKTPNAKSQATDAALSRQVACTDGLGVAVPPAPTFENGKD